MIKPYSELTEIDKQKLYEILSDYIWENKLYNISRVYDNAEENSDELADMLNKVCDVIGYEAI